MIRQHVFWYGVASADPDNLPFTNRRGEGFENKIAELLARSANQPLAYYWWPDRRGFVNKTLNAWECDVIIGVPTHDDMVRTTRPYYCSRYVMVHRQGHGGAPALLGEPQVRSLRIGVVERTPPLGMLLQRNLDPIVYFTNYDGVDNVAGQIVADVATGKIDVALVWGPVAGYFARRQAVPLQTERPQLNRLRAWRFRSHSACGAATRTALRA
jgi:mxaJ protein